METPTINTLILSRYGEKLLLGKKYHRTKYLSELFQIAPEQIVLLDPEGEEAVQQDNTFILDPTKHYTIVTKEEIEDDNEEVIEKSEKEKRERLMQLEKIRIDFITREWVPVHQWLYRISDRHFRIEFIEFIQNGCKGNCSVMKLTPTGIVHVPLLFSDEFCSCLLEEVEAIERSGLPLTRPNSMNNYGVVLADFGFNSLWKQLLDYIRPLLVTYYGPVCNSLDTQHAFIVQYRTTAQTSLGFHYDDSEITLNVCLGKSFSGGDLYFKGLFSVPETHSEQFIYHHKIGETIFHWGQHRHGAHPITEGSRYNLIIWYRASQLRQNLCKCCNSNKHA